MVLRFLSSGAQASMAMMMLETQKKLKEAQETETFGETTSDRDLRGADLSGERVCDVPEPSPDHGVRV